MWRCRDLLMNASSLRFEIALGQRATTRGGPGGDQHVDVPARERVCPLQGLGWQPWGHQKQRRRPVTCANSVSEGGLEPSERRFLDQRVSSICPGFPCQSGETGTQLLTVGAGYNGSVQPPGARMILVTGAAAAGLVTRLSRGALPTRRPGVGTRRRCGRSRWRSEAPGLRNGRR